MSASADHWDHEDTRDQARYGPTATRRTAQRPTSPPRPPAHVLVTRSASKKSTTRPISPVADPPTPRPATKPAKPIPTPKLPPAPQPASRPFPKPPAPSPIKQPLTPRPGTLPPTLTPPRVSTSSASYATFGGVRVALKPWAPTTAGFSPSPTPQQAAPPPPVRRQPPGGKDAASPADLAAVQMLRHQVALMAAAHPRTAQTTPRPMQPMQPMQRTAPTPTPSASPLPLLAEFGLELASTMLPRRW